MRGALLLVAGVAVPAAALNATCNEPIDLRWHVRGRSEMR
eukprot:gene17407-8092_t